MGGVEKTYFVSDVHKTDMCLAPILVCDSPQRKRSPYDFDQDFDAGAIKSLVTVFQQFVIPSRYIDRMIPWLKLSP
jgi:hypothetical protein